MKTLLLIALLFTDAPTATIDGPTERNSGALTFLDAGGSAGAEHFGWMVDTSSVQVPKEPAVDVSETVAQLKSLGFSVEARLDNSEPLWAVSGDGKRLWLSSYPGTYSVVLGVSNADGVTMLPWKIVVKGGKPIPPDPDNPKPPKPDEPLTGLAGKVQAAVKNTPATFGEFAEVADVYEAVASMAAAGALATPDDVVKITSTLSQAKLPTHLADWKAVVTSVIGPHLNALSQSGELETAAAHAPVWLEISKGIRAGIK